MWQVVRMTVLIIVGVLLVWVLIAPGCMTFRISDDKAMDLFHRKGLDLKTDYVKVNNREMHYTMVGNDSLPTLVFLHGSPSSWNAFLQYMQDPALLFHYRMVSIDRPGFGYSNFGYAVPLEEQSLLLLPVLKEINNNKPIYLAGHSLGGPLVVKLAADAPELVKGIMLISGSVSPELEPKEQWRFLMENFPLNHFLPGSFKPSNTELVYFKDDVKKLVNDFPKVTAEVYIVHGDKDTWVPPGNVDFAKQQLVNAAKVETLMIPGGNHFIPWTHRKEIIGEMVKMAEE